MHRCIWHNPNSSITGVVGEMPLEIRSIQNYWVNLKGYSQDHPTQNTVKPCGEKDLRLKASDGQLHWKATKLSKGGNICDKVVISKLTNKAKCLSKMFWQALSNKKVKFVKKLWFFWK